VPGDINENMDVFVRDRPTGRTERVSVGPGGAQADFRGSSAALSPGGRVVGFMTNAGNLVPGGTNGVGDVFVRTR